MTRATADRRANFALAVGFAALVITLVTMCSCTMVPAVAGYFTSGGVTLYKSAKESGPKAEFVAVKMEVHHDTYIVQPSPTPVGK